MTIMATEVATTLLVVAKPNPSAPERQRNPKKQLMIGITAPNAAPFIVANIKSLKFTNVRMATKKLPAE